ncbi:MAG: glycosyltransferase [Solirubrobacterales bacterium]|nr:glycosyltransferase [Solirubrobacterales bacterium]MBV9715565.1 glycosyltransferase [Solirubrobacterales bacterium]
MRALVVTSMYPSARAPARGVFVRDQVEALAAMPGVDLELFAFDPGGVRPYVRAAYDLRRRYRRTRFDIVHAHFGLTAWPALAVPATAHAVTLHGTDLAHPRSRAITLAALRFVDLAAPVSQSLAALLPARAARARVEILPCGVNLDRFHPIPRAEARRALGLDEKDRYALFPADPARREKRYDRARQIAGGATVLTLGMVEPGRVPLWVNAADAVLVPSERESFGLSVLEALACEVPVIATPVGIAPDALAGLAGTYCGSFHRVRWRAALDAVLAQPDPRVAGRAVAERYSAVRMAERVLAAWRALLARA